MILFSDSRGRRESVGYKSLAESYLENYSELVEDKFVVNMILMLDEWEVLKGMKFERIMPSDWDLLLKAIKVLSVEPTAV